MRGVRFGAGGRGSWDGLFRKEGQAVFGVAAGDSQSRVLPERSGVLVLVSGEQDDV